MVAAVIQLSIFQIMNFHYTYTLSAFIKKEFASTVKIFKQLYLRNFEIMKLPDVSMIVWKNQLPEGIQMMQK
jgi:hypothetical protein